MLSEMVPSRCCLSLQIFAHAVHDERIPLATHPVQGYCIMTCCCGIPPPATMTCGCTCGRARTSIGKQSTHGSLQTTDALG